VHALHASNVTGLAILVEHVLRSRSRAAALTDGSTAELLQDSGTWGYTQGYGACAGEVIFWLSSKNWFCPSGSMTAQAQCCRSRQRLAGRGLRAFQAPDRRDQRGPEGPDGDPDEGARRAGGVCAKRRRCWGCDPRPVRSRRAYRQPRPDKNRRPAMEPLAPASSISGAPLLKAAVFSTIGHSDHVSLSLKSTRSPLCIE
jgi:hypothetical protein